MKMGTILSPWRYDAASGFAESRSNVAVPSREHYVEKFLAPAFMPLPTWEWH
jgi:hypothetical protein